MTWFVGINLLNSLSYYEPGIIGEYMTFLGGGCALIYQVHTGKWQITSAKIFKTTNALFILSLMLENHAMNIPYARIV